MRNSTSVAEQRTQGHTCRGGVCQSLGLGKRIVAWSSYACIRSCYQGWQILERPEPDSQAQARRDARLPAAARLGSTLQPAMRTCCVRRDLQLQDVAALRALPLCVTCCCPGAPQSGHWRRRAPCRPRGAALRAPHGSSWAQHPLSCWTGAHLCRPACTIRKPGLMQAGMTKLDEQSTFAHWSATESARSGAGPEADSAQGMLCSLTAWCWLLRWVRGRRRSRQRARDALLTHSLVLAAALSSSQQATKREQANECTPVKVPPAVARAAPVWALVAAGLLPALPRAPVCVTLRLLARVLARSPRCHRWGRAGRQDHWCGCTPRRRGQRCSLDSGGRGACHSTELKAEPSGSHAQPQTRSATRQLCEQQLAARTTQSEQDAAAAQA